MEAPYGILTPAAEETSQQYVGRWLQLVSTTNWEKGRIIAEWRAALIADSAPANEYSDEAWSRRLGNISGQHAGRLRRTFARFHDVCAGYQGLYWSHFQAALDWDDAEMWLEGAVQNGWSISEMRRERGTTLGGPIEETTQAEVVEEFDEDAEPSETAAEIPRTISATEGVIADHEESDKAEDETDDADAEAREYRQDDLADDDESVRPFAELAELPSDLADAFESFKLAILRHKLAGWTEVARGEVLASLKALEQLALAPS